MNLNAIPLFRYRGIPVQLHWSWFLVALVEVMWRTDSYGHWAWNLAEYVLLFIIVLMHEFGHAIACQQVGGSVDRILLWPLGGVAQVRPPQRPGALLWSIVAGPLVNLVLAVPAFALLVLIPDGAVGPDAIHALQSFLAINVVLFLFNMLPIYPLDGGQVARALLWFAIGRERSLLVAASIGLVASIVGGAAAAIVLQDYWMGIIGLYAAWHSWKGIKAARAQQTILRLPKHPRARCPHCGEAPPDGPIVRCSEGHPVAPYDTEPPGTCPACGSIVVALPCIHCHQEHSPAQALARPATQHKGHPVPDE